MTIRSPLNAVSAIILSFKETPTESQNYIKTCDSKNQQQKKKSSKRESQMRTNKSSSSFRSVFSCSAALYLRLRLLVSLSLPPLRLRPVLSSSPVDGLAVRLRQVVMQVAAALSKQRLARCPLSYPPVAYLRTAC